MTPVEFLWVISGGTKVVIATMPTSRVARAVKHCRHWQQWVASPTPSAVVFVVEGEAVMFEMWRILFQRSNHGGLAGCGREDSCV